MKTIKIEANQSLRDIAIAHYGTLEALGELLAINAQGLRNDRAALVAIGVDYLTDDAFYLDAPLEVGSIVQIDEQSRLRLPMTVKELRTTPQTKYN